MAIPAEMPRKIRRAETHAKVFEIAGKGMDFWLAGNWHENEHENEQEPVLTQWLLIEHVSISVKEFMEKNICHK